MVCATGAEETFWSSHSWGPVFAQARSRHDLRSDGKRETYLWGQLHLVDGNHEFQLVVVP